MLEHKKRQGNRQMLYLVDLYKREHPEDGDEIDPESVAEWAIAEKKYIPPPVSPSKLLRRKISRALAHDYYEDPQGREVRKYHFIVEQLGSKKKSKAYQLEIAPPEHMRISGAMRRTAALRDVIQLKLDFDSYNDNNIFGATLPPYDFNFNQDIEEMSLPTEYDDTYNGIDFEDEDDENEEEDGVL